MPGGCGATNTRDVLETALNAVLGVGILLTIDLPDLG